MENAEQHVKGFLSHNNQHSVDIEQVHAPAVVHEKVVEARHENIIQAHDREIHQHHHQVHVQPIHHKVVEPEKHHHNVLAVEHREHHHGKDHEVERALQEQASQFRDEREVLPMQQSQSVKTVVGEHVHHHIHDVIQPVVEREIYQPHVVHTTVPIHETIHKEPIIHTGNVLPSVTMEEFEKHGVPLTGGHIKKEHIDYQGEPLKIHPDSRVGFAHHHHHNQGTAGTAGIEGGLAGTHLAESHGTHGTHTHGTHTHGTHTHGTHGVGSGSPSSIDNEYSTRKHHAGTAGPHNSNIANKLDPRVDSDLDGSRTVGNTGVVGQGLTGTHGTRDAYDTTGTTGLTGTRGTTGLTGTHGTTGLTGTRDAYDTTGTTGLTGNTTGHGLTGTHGTMGHGLTGTHGTTGHGLTGTRNTTDDVLDSPRESNYTNTSTGLTGSTNLDNDPHKIPRSAGTAHLGHGIHTDNTGLTQGENVTTETPVTKTSTTSKILHSVGLGSK